MLISVFVNFGQGVSHLALYEDETNNSDCPIPILSREAKLCDFYYSAPGNKTSNLLLF